MDIFYNGLNGFAGILDAFNHIAEVFSTPLDQWFTTMLNESVLGKALSVLIMPIISQAGFTGLSIGSLMLGGGLSIFVMFSLGRWIIGLK